MADHLEIAAEPIDDAFRATPRARRRRSLFAAAVVLLVGVAVSLVGATLWRSSVQTHERQTFDATTADVTATLETQLRRDVDFDSTLRAVLTMQPHMSPSQFARWFGEMRGEQRLAGGLGATVVKRDWCRRSSPIGASQGPLLRAQTDTGQVLALPVSAQGLRTIIFQPAFYRSGARLASVAQRRGAITGWVLSSFDIDPLLRLATGDHPGLTVALFHSNPGDRAEAISRVGPAVRSGGLTRTGTIQIEGLWTIEVSGKPIAAGLSAATQFLLVLGLGALVSVLLAALIMVLARSRERALGMVHEKAGQLRHQAMHDALTGLPNRVLALDRAQQMLARARRQQLSIAVLYIDLDGF